MYLIEEYLGEIQSSLRDEETGNFLGPLMGLQTIVQYGALLPQVYRVL